MASQIALFLGFTASWSTGAAFNFFGSYDRVDVASSFGVSSSCLVALTVDCDPINANRAAYGVDNEYWTVDNITSLCTKECSGSLSSWLSAVEYQCAGEQIVIDGIASQPKSFPWKYIAGYGMACLQDRSADWCLVKSQDWDDNKIENWAPEECDNGDEPSKECGDAGTPDIGNNATSVTEAYPQEIYCSECFLLLWRQRVLYSSYATSDIKEYLTDQYGKLEVACATRIAPTSPYSIPVPEDRGVVTAMGDLPMSIAAEATAAAAVEAGPYYTTATAAIPTQPGALEPCGHYYNVQPGDTCQGIAQRFGISVYDLKRYNKQIDRHCLNIWAYHAICVAPVSERPAEVDDDTCDPESDYTACKDGLCCSSEGQCEPCESEIYTWTETATETGWEPGITTDIDTETETEAPTQTETETELTSRTESTKTMTTTTSEKRASPTPSPTTQPKLPVSKDGKCSKSISCVGSGFGDCCSSSGYCGSGPQWCGIGNCISGPCDTESGGQSTDGKCGPRFPGNKTCVGTQFGECCSTSGYCGSTEKYCAPENCYSGKCHQVVLEDDDDWEYEYVYEEE